jgi:predicted XRE-type DNA-binding protein
MKCKGSFGSRLYELQQGKTPLDIKPLSQFGSGVYELRESFDGNAYRLIYVVNLKKALYVLHVARLHQKIEVRDWPAETGRGVNRRTPTAGTRARFGGLNMAKIPFEKSGGNVFVDIGFAPAEAAELTAKSSLIIAIEDTIEQRKLTQQEAARLCGTDQPTLSKVFRGRMESVTIDRLASWLNALGRDVEIIVKPAPRTRRHGRLRVIEAA